MENCIIKKLKSVVNDVNLSPLGTLAIKYAEVSPNADLLGFYGTYTSVATLKIVGDATWNSGVSHVTYINNKEIQLEANRKYEIHFTAGASGGDIYVYAENKYNISELRLSGKVQISDLAYSTELTDLRSYYNVLEGDIANLIKLVALTSMSCSSTTLTDALYGDISVFSNMPNLTSVGLNLNRNIYGDISSFVNCTNINTLDLRSCEGITGSINDLSNLTSLSALRVSYASELEGDLNQLLNQLFTNGKRGNLTVRLEATKVEYVGTKDVKTQTITFTFDDNGWTENA